MKLQKTIISAVLIFSTITVFAGQKECPAKNFYGDWERSCDNDPNKAVHISFGVHGDCNQINYQNETLQIGTFEQRTVSDMLENNSHPVSNMSKWSLWTEKNQTLIAYNTTALQPMDSIKDAVEFTSTYTSIKVVGDKLLETKHQVDSGSFNVVKTSCIYTRER